MEPTDGDCENPRHRQAMHIAVEAEIVGEALLGVDLLLTGWGGFLAHSDPGSDGHGQVTLALSFLLQTLAERLQPSLPPAEATSAPDSSGPRPTVVPGGAGLSAATPDGA